MLLRAPRRARTRRAEAARAARLTGGGEAEATPTARPRPHPPSRGGAQAEFFSAGAPPLVLSSSVSPSRTYFPIEDCVVLQATGISAQSSGGERSPGAKSKSSMGRWLPQRGWLGHDGLSGGGETEATMGQGKRPDGALVSTALTLTLHSGCRPNRIRSIPTILAGRIDDGPVDVSAVDTELQTWSTQWGHGREVRCSRPWAGRFFSHLAPSGSDPDRRGWASSHTNARNKSLWW